MSDGSTVTLYQPQIETWYFYTSITARLAVSVTPPKTENSVVGALRLTADTKTNFNTRTVLVFNMKITEARFPSLQEQEAGRITRLLGELLPTTPLTLALDRLLAGLERSQLLARSEGEEADFSMEPPAIYVSHFPVILVLIDGDPVFAPIEGTNLGFAVNTNWDLLLDAKKSTHYLRYEDIWLQAPTLASPWTPAGKLPKSFSKLPKDENWKEVRENIPGREVVEHEVPRVIVSTAPAELIVIDGGETLQPIPETKLFYVVNTENDLFFLSSDEKYYYLVSGRWFRAKGLNGPWSSANKGLPAEFARIPADHPRGRVRASVAGTPEAQEALLLAEIPRKAEVRRSEATVIVTYSGDPDFKPIEGTSMSYAVNTSYDVVKVGDWYYVCFQGVWFVSTSPNGPWEVAASVPSEVYTIPPGSPKHHVTYVHVYDSSLDVVVFGYTSGYWGVYTWGGYVVFGTGYYYSPYVYYGPHPVYYPYHYSYGVSAWYNPYTGTYGRGAEVYGPYGGYGRAAAYSPATGTYARGVAAYGPYQRGWGEKGYNPRFDISAASYQRSNSYAQWGGAVLRRRDEDGWFTKKTAENNLYAGDDGIVYKRDERGWSKHEDGDWIPLESLQKQRLAEQETTRTSQISSSESSSILPQSASGRTLRSTFQEYRGSQAETMNRLHREFEVRMLGMQRINQYHSWWGDAAASGRPFQDRP